MKGQLRPASTPPPAVAGTAGQYFRPTDHPGPHPGGHGLRGSPPGRSGERRLDLGGGCRAGTAPTREGNLPRSQPGKCLPKIFPAVQGNLPRVGKDPLFCVREFFENCYAIFKKLPISTLHNHRQVDSIFLRKKTSEFRTPINISCYNTHTKSPLYGQIGRA